MNVYDLGDCTLNEFKERHNEILDNFTMNMKLKANGVEYDLSDQTVIGQFLNRVERLAFKPYIITYNEFCTEIPHLVDDIHVGDSLDINGIRMTFDNKFKDIIDFLAYFIELTFNIKDAKTHILMVLDTSVRIKHFEPGDLT